MRKVLRTVYFTSALAPAVVVLAATHFYRLGPSAEVIGWMIAGLVGCVFPLLIVEAIFRHAEVLPATLKKVESAEWLMFAAVLAYLIPLAFSGIGLSQLAGIILLAGLVLSAIDAMPFHPVLHIFRYRFYKVEMFNGVVYWLVARGRIIDPSKVTHVREIAPGLIMEDRR